MRRALALAGVLWVLGGPALAGDAATASAEARLESALETARQNYDKLRDYRAIFHKTENGEEGLGPSERIFLKFTKPFKIFMAWQNTHKKGLQVFYERGKHDNKLAVHQPGLFFGLAQVVFLEQSSPYVREGSASFDIEDAGIGTFLEDFTKAVEHGRAKGQLSVTEADGVFDVTFPGSKPEDEALFAYRVAVRFDARTSLPDKMDLYDWQQRPIGFYEYADIRTDIGEQDPDFTAVINRRLARVYAGR